MVVYEFEKLQGIRNVWSHWNFRINCRNPTYNDMWTTGPDFLKLNKSEWPKSAYLGNRNKEKIRNRFFISICLKVGEENLKIVYLNACNWPQSKKLQRDREQSIEAVQRISRQKRYNSDLWQSKHVKLQLNDSFTTCPLHNFSRSPISLWKLLSLHARGSDLWNKVIFLYP